MSRNKRSRKATSAPTRPNPLGSRNFAESRFLADYYLQFAVGYPSGGMARCPKGKFAGRSIYPGLVGTLSQPVQIGFG